jgi:hypothetical protein
MTRRTLSVAATILAVSGLIASAQYAKAQYSNSSYDRSTATTPAPIYYPMAFPSGYRNHASTSEQGFLSGLGDLYRGVGEYEVAASVAAYNWQLARSAALQNNIVERASRAQVYKHSALAQDLQHLENKKKNQRVAAFHAKQARPMLLAASQLDKTTGRVQWPTILYEGRFEKDRLEAEAALREKYDKKLVATNNSDQPLVAAINGMQARLEKDKDQMRPADFYSARAFLIRMKNEVSVSSQNLAASL